MPRRRSRPDPSQLELPLDAEAVGELPRFSESAESPESSGRVPDRKFLGWADPAVGLTASFLLESESGIDFSEVLVVVPTQSAARRLGDSLLAGALEAERSGVHPPTVLSPGAALNLRPPPRPLAAPVELLAAWIEVLRATDPVTLPNLLPKATTLDDPAFAGHLAEEMIRLGSALGENGLLFEDVNRLVPGNPEPGRWEELTHLQNRTIQALDRRGLEDPHRWRKAMLADGEVPDGFRHVILAGVADPPPALLGLLARLPPEVRLTALCFAPPEFGNRFDAWGRPEIDAWAPDSGWEIPLAGEALHLLRDPDDQAQVVANLLATEGNPVGLALCDEAVKSALKRRLEMAETPHHDPGGLPFRCSSLAAILALVSPLVQEGGWREIEALLRCPEVLSHLAREARVSEGKLLSDVDQFQSNTHVSTLKAGMKLARRFSAFTSVDRALGALDGMLRDFASSSGLASALRSLCETIYGDSKWDLENLHDRLLADSLPRVLEAADRLDQGDYQVGATGRVVMARKLDLLLKATQDLTSFRAWEPGEIDLTGWLEIFWSDASQVVIAGANETTLPGVAGPDPYLPQSLRAELGLRLSSGRFARDAYLLSAILSARSGEAGRADVLLGKWDHEGNPLAPSRLLLMVPDTELPARVEFLFGDPDRPAGLRVDGHAWSPAWRLLPPAPVLPSTEPDPGDGTQAGDRPPPTDSEARIPTVLSPTAFRDYLRCPFEFYLKKVVRMREAGGSAAELDPMQFGYLVHDAFEAFGEDEVASELTDAHDIEAYLLGELDRLVGSRYGSSPALPVRIQVEALRQRIHYAAFCQAGERATGWRIISAEEVLGKDRDWEIGGMAVRGQVDRLERNENDGSLRILDYKTGAAGKAPDEAHWGSSTPTNIAPEDLWKSVETPHGLRLWSELQLPLYADFISRREGQPVAVGYFNLPRAATQTEVVLWESMTAEVTRSALDCAAEIARRVQDGLFWPPNPNPWKIHRKNPNPYLRIFPRGVRQAIDPTHITGQSGSLS